MNGTVLGDELFEGSTRYEHLIDQAALGEQPVEDPVLLEDAVERPAFGGHPSSAPSASTGRAGHGVDEARARRLGNEPVDGAVLGEQPVERTAGREGAAERPVVAGEHGELLDPRERAVAVGEPGELLDRPFLGE